MALYGADIAQMRQLARLLVLQAEQLETSVAHSLTNQVRGTSAWRGPDAEHFRSDWSASLEPSLRRAAQQLREASERVTANANEQEQASRGNGGAGASVTGAGASVAGAGPSVALPSGLGDDPQATSRWWAGLSDAEKQRMIEKDPRMIGSLDGVDAASRDKANRIVLAEEKKLAQERVDNYWKTFSPEPDEVRIMEYNRLKHDLEELKRVENALNGGTPNDPRHLIALDFSGERLKAAVSVGNVDKASHVSVIVPGMTTNVHDSLGTNISAAENVKNRAAVLGGMRREDIAVVAWLGYDAPQGLIGASNTDRAHKGAEKLSSFVTGLDSSREHSPAGDPLLTLIGHSYGSTTSGFAATQTQDGVIDKLVLAGSPGSGVKSLDEYSVPEGNVYVSATPWDPVLGVGPDRSFGTNPQKLEGIKHLNADISGGDNGWITGPMDRHTSYFKEKTEALDDIARVSAGKK